MPTKEKLLKLAISQNKARKYQETIDLLNSELLTKYESAELYGVKARAYNELGKLDFALKLADQAIEIDKTFVAAYNTQGLAWARKKEYDKAIHSFTLAIQLNPSDTLYRNRGLAWQNKKEYFKAIEDYSAAIKKNPDFAEAYNCRGTAWYDIGELDKSIEDYNKAIELKPKHTLAYRNRGLAWNSKKEFNKAIEDYNLAIDVNPKYEKAYNSRGNAWLNKGKLDKALHDYNRAIELGFQPLEIVHRNIGLVWNEKKEYNKAIEEYYKALKINPDYADAYRSIGDSYKLQGDFEKAIEYYEKSINHDDSLTWLKPTIDELKAKTRNINDIKISDNEKTEKSIYFLVKTINTLAASEEDKKALRDKGQSFWLAMEKIRDSSFANNQDNVVHYTNLRVADILANNESDAYLRYYNVVYMNDPEEGQIIFDCLDDKDIKDCFKDGMDIQDNNIYLGSFLPAEKNNKKNNHEDELVMWRTYGKDENKTEAAGCSIVINPDFFGRDKQYLHVEMRESENPTENKKSFEANQALYSVLYFDKRDNTLLDPRNKGLVNLINDLKSTIKAFIALKTNKPDSNIDLAINKITYRFITEIRYLFKSADYSFENELRVVQYASPQFDKKINLVKIDGDERLQPRRLFIESNKPIRDYIDTIYLGPKVPNPKRWMYLEAVMKMKGHESMQLKESNCKFQ